MTLKELHKQFLEYLEIERNRSLKTVENYDRYLKRFFNFAEVSDANDIDDELVRKYRLYLNRLGENNGKALKKQTQGYHLIALRNFLKYLAKRGIKTLTADRIELGKTPSRQVEFLEGEELNRLLESASGKDLKNLRDRAILELLFSTGLRVSELCSLNRDSVNLKRDEFTVRGKGDKIRVVFLSETAKSALKNYLEKRTDVNEALFISAKRQETSDMKQVTRLTPRSIQRMIKIYSAKAGITKKVTPHTLRHSYATDLLFAGADLRSVQALLGHSSITTTQIYTHVTDKALKEVHRKYHGQSRKI
ncbi:MAG: hypothetical protein A3G49_03540 [Candidatus Sungbacteria bacterium RIFCSPLOWO2_12_FULL_41_11]|uniref:Tyrosine recombinase XerC n=1 Tax=Candidatus Sungbacteria bacterium RIFCSPLOWO2_12_FULL_41_11 TaxID=1802286 RepID=A0A1G2LT89_9BACT|nr:MAG: hypothetical protein A3D41_04000 [Candidatus Sungbacteria bacterium RIFCSPHIGHO2_02_FULL_41_12b]OHA14773.1 MAG: hypothetical protein A3G49_03540 [Candidatus Sungbacteria bacterium RIFCSPLOWO2_12_FULL_41_11]